LFGSITDDQQYDTPGLGIADGPATGGIPAMTTPRWLPAAADAVQRQAAAFVKENALPGAVVGIVAGDDPDAALAWSGGFGWGGGPSEASGSASPALGADTLFRVASITKTFTATALVQLRDAGKLHLDDPLVKHLPEFGAVINPFGPIEDVTLRRVASHSSGLMGEPPLDHWISLRFPTRAEWLASLPGVRVAIPPGSAFKYSNLGYTLLGEVIERITGQPYVAYMHEAVLAPLGLTSTVYDLTDTLRPRAATGHMAHPYEDAAEVALLSPLNGMAAAGQLWTTARDLSRWISAHLRASLGANDGMDTSLPGGRLLLSPRSLYEMQQACYVEPGWVGGYGFGWRIIRRGDRVYHGHGGSVPGFRSQILFDAALKVGIVVLIDGVGAADALAAGLMDTLAAPLQAAADAPRPARQPAPTPAAYRPFLGLYRMRHVGDASFRIEYRAGSLRLDDGGASPFPGAPPTTLEPTAEPTVFLVRGGRYAGEPLTFSVADDRAVTGFRVSGFDFIHLR
jgi:D-alanyl-D-alanine carboxypeptidase